MASSNLAKLDVIVFGATGDTGRLSCHYLFNNAKRLQITSWAPAARNLQKLQRLLPTMFSDDTPSPEHGVRPSVAIEADVTDYDSILRMAQRAKVVMTCTGPYTLYGENVVRACVEAGCDYVDITGETKWVNAMAKKYDDAAKEGGVSVLSQSGYDSVPSDITVALAAMALREKEEVICTAETHHYLLGGAMPVGTLKTVLNMFKALRNKMLRSLTFGLLGGSGAVRKVQSAGKGAGGSPLIPRALRKKISSDSSWNFWWPYCSLSGFTMPGFMASINTPIVHGTAHALGYSDHFSYRERLGRNDSTWMSLYGLIPFTAKVLGLTVGAVIVMPVFIPMFLLFPETASNAVEGLIGWDLGNRKKAVFDALCDGFQPDGTTAVRAIASSVSGESFAEVDFESDYDAGLGFTVLCALTVSAAILEQRRNGEKGNGFETAVVGIGPQVLKEWLETAGVRIRSRVRGKL